MPYPQDKGQADKVLNTGRIAFGGDGTNFRPLAVDTEGKLLLPASTVNVGEVDTLITETIQAELLAHTAVAASAQALSSVLSLIGIKKATVFIDHGRAATTAWNAVGTEYRIEASEKAAGNDTWRTLASLVAASAVASSISVTADEAAGQTVLETTSATTLVAGDIIYWANTVTIGNGEWARLVAVAAGTSITIQDGLTNAQDSDTSIYNKAEHFVLVLDVEPFTRMRVVVNNNNAGTTNVALQCRIACITEK